MSTRPIALTWLVLASLAAACGDNKSTVSFVDGDDDSGGGERDSGRNDDTGGGEEDIATGTDTSVGTDTTTAVDTTPDAPETGDPVQGGVTIYEVRAPDVDELNVGGVAAGIQALSEDSGETVVATVGSCQITAVAPDSNPFPDEPTLDAGMITVSVGAETYHLTVAATPAGNRYDAGVDSSRNEFFTGGQLVSVSAAGGADVGAFSGSVQAPDDPVVTSPDWEPLGDGHSRTEDLTVTWGGATSGGDVIISILPITIFPEAGVADGNAITCTVPDTGSAVIPAGALGYLPEGGGFSSGQDVALTVVRAVSSEVGLGAELLVNATASHTLIGVVD